MPFSKQNTLNNTLDIESQKEKYPDEQLQQKNKRELIQTIQQLSIENERQRGVIAYQREENQNLTNRLLDINYQEKLQTEKTDKEGTLLPLLEAMEERQVSIDGKTFPLSESFLVVATQNPIEQEGTYPLPEAQLDRFLMKIRLDYPTTEDERAILGRYGKCEAAHDGGGTGANRISEGDWVPKFRNEVHKVTMEEGIVGYVQTLLEQTRKSHHLYLGASPRGGIALLRTSQCLAALSGRDFITPDDIKQMALPVLRHRVILRPEAELEGLTPDRVLLQILEGIPVPR